MLCDSLEIKADRAAVNSWVNAELVSLRDGSGSPTASEPVVDFCRVPYLLHGDAHMNNQSCAKGILMTHHPANANLKINRPTMPLVGTAQAPARVPMVPSPPCSASPLRRERRPLTSGTMAINLSAID